MGAFTPADHLPVRVYHDRPDMPFETAAPVRFTNAITRVVIPAGFALDFASVPRWLWWLYPRVGRYARAALVHDALYRRGDVGRAQADALFLEIMRVDGVPRWQRWPMHAAVRVFGGAAWRKLRREVPPSEHGWVFYQPRPVRAWTDEAAPLAYVLVAVLALLLLSATARGQSVCGPQGCPPVYEAPGWRPPSAATPAPANVARITERAGGGTGTATLVAHAGDRSAWLTCWHVLEGGGDPIEVTLPDGRRLRGQLGAEVDKPNDLAVVWTPRVTLEPVVVSPAEPAGQVRGGGFGPDGRWRLAPGPVLGWRTPMGATAPSVVWGAPVRSGDSGGPLYDARGRLVGVVWGSAEGRSYATAGGPLRRLLARVRQRIAPGPATPPVVVVPPAPAHPSPRPVTPALPDWSPPDWSELDGRYVPRETYDADQTETRSLLERLRDRVASAVRSGAGVAVSYGTRELLLGVGGPVGLGLAGGAALLGLLRRSGQQTARSGQGGRPLGGDVIVADAGHGRAAGDGRPSVRREGGSQPPTSIVVDAPERTRHTIENRFVPYENDAFQSAHAWASEQIARRYPGAVEHLTSLDSLIRQKLNARA